MRATLRTAERRQIESAGGPGKDRRDKGLDVTGKDAALPVRAARLAAHATGLPVR